MPEIGEDVCFPGKLRCDTCKQARVLLASALDVVMEARVATRLLLAKLTLQSQIEHIQPSMQSWFYKMQIRLILRIDNAEPYQMRKHGHLRMRFKFSSS